MAKAETVRVHGMWASPFVRRVVLCLKVKGIPFEYVEENLANKSQELLLYNPVHKKVPVLLHNGIPLCESLVIIEYIEETWKNSPPVLPEDPYERAKVHFWANFIDQKILEIQRSILLRCREEDMKELRENLDKLEGNMRDIFPNGHPRSERERMGLLDILICTFSGVIGAFEEVMKSRYLDPNKHPLIITWMKTYDGLDFVKETAPPHERLVEFFKGFERRRQMLNMRSYCNLGQFF